MKKKTTLSLLFLAGLGLSGLNAQEASTAAGGDATGAGGSASYSVGQVSYTSIENAAGSVNQGVQQPYQIVVTGVNTTANIEVLMSVYPNPSTSFITIKVEDKDLANLTFQLFDVQGKLLISEKITQTETAVQMADFAKGNYFLKVVNNKAELKSFKIIKN
ncbi:MAG: T9SS type A sorting domain-containing protein [Bacteroidota bacterium]|nr:T9SS type A sorting domain-containing protein [Bacteroidota bacterium]